MPGPYLIAALFCERVLQEQDGVLSAIRIIDQTVHTVAGPGADVPGEMPPMLVAVTALIMLKPGDARGRYTIRIRPEKPSGEQMPPLEAPVRFEGGEGDRGANLIVPIQMQVEDEGLYWFDVLWVDERAPKDQQETLLSRIPLRVVYQPLRLPPTSA